jgi:hypothetical protein
MTETEVNRFQAVLTARVAELERVSRRHDAITVERSADQLEEIRRLYNAHSRFATSTENSTTFERPCGIAARAA